MTSPAETPRTFSSWRLWLPLALQAALILAVPAQAIYVHLTGKTVMLQTVPVDPYDLLRGYSVILNYDISRADRFKKVPGWDTLLKETHNQSYLLHGSRLYVILEAPTTQSSEMPKPWKPVRVSRDRPTALPANQVALEGKVNYNSVEYGLETYYIPEDQRQQINENIAQAQRPPRTARAEQMVVVETKVDANGRAVPVSLWLKLNKNRRGEVLHYRF